MKRFVFGGLGMAALLSASLTSCKAMMPETVQSQIDTIKEDATDKIAEDAKETFLSQLDEFIQNDALNSSIGFSEEEKEALESSIDDYLNNYDWNTEELEKTKSDLSSFWEELSKQAESSSLTKEDINKKLDEILKK